MVQPAGGLAWDGGKADLPREGLEAKGLWESQSAPGEMRDGFWERHLEVETQRAKAETPFGLSANKTSSNPQLFTPTVTPPKVLASPVQFSFNSCVCICKWPITCARPCQ